MRLGQTPRLEQQQKLIITPELKQAILVLQLPVAELEDYVAAEALDNPLLDLRADGEVTPSVDDTPEPEWLEYFHDASDLGYLRPAAETLRTPEQAAPAPTLADHLAFQLAGLSVSEPLRRACSFLIDSLDQNGYLTLTVAEAAAAQQLRATLVGEALRLLQSFDPPGVGARTLSECLSLQLALRDDAYPLALAIIADHLDDLAAGRLARIATACDVPLTEVEAAAAVVRSLDPKPGRAFSTGENPRYIRPDAVIERVGDEYVVIINDPVTPRLRLSPYYRNLLNQGLDEKTQHYLQDRLRSALWLTRSLEQRRMTLYRIVEAIARFQHPFMAFGVRHLHPLTLRDVAEAIGLHESTISRATANKYVQTPQGCHALRFFFSSGVGQGVGGGVAATSVRQIIRDLIAAEDPSAPLSDEQIAARLDERGIPISRRTVAKYRTEAGLPSSTRRRR